MGRFKVGDKVVPSKQMREQCEVSEWFERVKDKVEDDGYLVVSQVCGSGTYIAEGLSSIVFIDEWLEPYIEQGPLTLLIEDGLSVRDRFAMAALSGMLAHSTRYKPREEGADWHWSIAKEAYELADAMMERRKK